MKVFFFFCSAHYISKVEGKSTSSGFLSNIFFGGEGIFLFARFFFFFFNSITLRRTETQGGAFLTSQQENKREEL